VTTKDGRVVFYECFSSPEAQHLAEQDDLEITKIEEISIDDNDVDEFVINFNKNIKIERDSFMNEIDEKIWHKFIQMLSIDSFGIKEVANGKVQKNLFGSVDHHKKIFKQACREQLIESLKDVREMLRNITDNFDCDSGANGNPHSDHCRCCNAQKVLERLNEALNDRSIDCWKSRHE